MFEENRDFDLDYLTEDWSNDDFALNLPSTSKQETSNQKVKNVQTIISNSSNTHLQSNTSRSSTSKIENTKPKVILKRKFPGPAGLFPQYPPGSSDEGQNPNKNDSFPLSTQFLCSQSNGNVFDEPSWLKMSNEFADDILRKYNIKYIQEHLIYSGIPFLAAGIKKVTNTMRNHVLLLVDLTGEMEALISPDLYEEYSEYLVVNSVILLKEFSILSISNQKNYINIISDNLIRIYFSKELDEDVKIINLKEISLENLRKNVELTGRNQKDKLDIKKFTNVLQKKDQNKSQNCENNIFEKSSNDLDLNFDDFADEFLIPGDKDEKTESVISKNDKASHLFNKTEGISPNKKIKSNTFKFKKKTCNFEFPGDINCDLVNKSVSVKENKIDCSQISVISQNNENPDVIKEIFADLSAEDLFDDF